MFDPARRSALVLAIAALSCVIAPSGRARAQAGATDAPSGDGRAALPGLLLTRVATEAPRGFAIRGLASYGLTESVDVAPGPHHRVAGSLGLSGQPLRWLGIGLSLDGRYDRHPDDGAGHDAGFVTRTLLEVRATPSLGHGLSLGVALAAIAYGNTGRSFEADALSFEGTLLASIVRGRFRIAGEVGYRLDRAAASAPASNVVLRPGDRLALGLSSYDAILGRLGASVRAGSVDLYLEGSLDALVGAHAPRLSLSPLHAAIGLRVPLGDRLRLDAFADVRLSARPTLPNAGPYVPVDPRITVGVALAYRYGGPRAPAGESGAEHGSETETASENETQSETNPPEGRGLAGLLLDASGAPLVDAHVMVAVGERSVDGYTDAEGRFALAGIPDGEAILRVEAVGHATHEQMLGSGRLSLPDSGLQLTEASAHGTLRGLVVGFEGEAVHASISITPGHHSARTESDGSFELPLPSGRYTVRVEAPGYASQTRDVHLTDGGVTILNLELRRER